MSGIINLLAFLVLTAMQITYLFRYSARLKDPTNSSRYLLLEGTEMFFVVLMATATLALSSSGVGTGGGSGFNLQSIRLLLLEVLIVLSFFIVRCRPRWGVGTVVYLAYLLWLVVSLTMTPALDYGVRYLLKYLFPFLMMLCASAIVRDEKVFLAVCVWARRIALLSTTVIFIPFVKWQLLLGFFWYETALNLHYVAISVLSFALFFFYGRDWRDLLLAVIFVLPCIVEVHRTGLMAMFAGLAVFFFFKFRWISLPYIVGVLAIGAAIVIYVPSFHEKMFWKDTEQEISMSDLYNGNVSEEDIRNNGREALWGMLEDQFYKGHELTGSGLGCCQWLLYSNPDIVKQTHGDYIQMRCDTGQIGMWLYIAVAVAILLHCFVMCVNPYNPAHVKCCAMIAASAVTGHFFGMYSDNVVTYTMATTGVSFAFYGMALGLSANVEKPHETLKAGSL